MPLILAGAAAVLLLLWTPVSSGARKAALSVSAWLQNMSSRRPCYLGQHSLCPAAVAVAVPQSIWC